MPLFKTERCQFLVENLNLPLATGVEDAKWEHFQLDHLNDDNKFRIEDKSRQIAFSFTVAAEALAEAVLAEQDTIFVSINLEEAKEKVRYAKAVYEAIEGVKLPRLITDNALELEFEGRHKSRGARITSMPSKPPRGRARSNVVLDEFAHVQDDAIIYTAALPITSKGGRVRIGSSLAGPQGKHWEISQQQLQKYPGFTRKVTPWWEVYAFCKNVKEARQLAPAMETRDRVELFGKDAIKAIFSNMVVEDFQQEYEATYVDESTAWISWEEIKSIQNSDPLYICVQATGKNGKLDKVIAAIDLLSRFVQAGQVEQVMGVGVDIGRVKHATEIFVVGITTTKQIPLRMAITLENIEFDDQLAILLKMMEKLPILKMYIDRTGLGRNLAENAQKEFPIKIEGVDFTNATKALWATDAKMLTQQGKPIIPADRDLAYQIHSVKRILTGSKNFVFDVVGATKHHADKFWAWALALAASGKPAKPSRWEEQFSSVHEQYV